MSNTPSHSRSVWRRSAKGTYTVAYLIGYGVILAKRSQAGRRKSLRIAPCRHWRNARSMINDSHPAPPRTASPALTISQHTPQNSITLLIVLNTLVLAMDHHPMDEGFSTYLEVFNFAFSLCFMLEMVLKVRWLFNGMPVPCRGAIRQRNSFFIDLNMHHLKSTYWTTCIWVRFVVGGGMPRVFDPTIQTRL